MLAAAGATWLARRVTGDQVEPRPKTWYPERLCTIDRGPVG